MSRKFKVLHIVTTLELGGAQKNTLFTIKHLDADKYDTYLACGQEGILHGKEFEIPEKKVFYIKSLCRKIRPIKDFRALLELYRVIRKHHFDIVHTHSSKAGIIGRIAARLARTPVIIHTVHGWGFHDYQHKWVRRFYILMEKFCIRFTTQLITVSDETMRIGFKEGIGRIDQYTKIHSAIDSECFREISLSPQCKRKELGLRADDFVALNIACFKPQKNHVDLINIAKKVIAVVPHIKFVLVGDGELREDIRKRIIANDLTENFLLLGWRHDVPELLKMCDLLVMTSLFEGLPQVCLQALAVGKPMLMYGAGGIKEVIQNGVNGYVIDRGDVVGFSERLIDLARDHQRLERMAAASKSLWKPEYGIHDMVVRIDKLYKKCFHSTGSMLHFSESVHCL